MPEDKKYSEQIYETLGQIDPEFSKETPFKDFEDGMQDNAYSKQIYDLLGQHDKSFTESVNLNDFSSEFKKKVQSQPSSKPVTLGYGSVAEIPTSKLDSIESKSVSPNTSISGLAEKELTQTNEQPDKTNVAIDKPLYEHTDAAQFATNQFNKKYKTNYTPKQLAGQEPIPQPKDALETAGDNLLATSDKLFAGAMRMPMNATRIIANPILGAMGFTNEQKKDLLDSFENTDANARSMKLISDHYNTEGDKLLESIQGNLKDNPYQSNLDAAKQWGVKIAGLVPYFLALPAAGEVGGTALMASQQRNEVENNPHMSEDQKDVNAVLSGIINNVGISYSNKVLAKNFAPLVEKVGVQEAKEITAKSAATSMIESLKPYTAITRPLQGALTGAGIQIANEVNEGLTNPDYDPTGALSRIMDSAKTFGVLETAGVVGGGLLHGGIGKSQRKPVKDLGEKIVNLDTDINNPAVKDETKVLLEHERAKTNIELNNHLEEGDRNINNLSPEQHNEVVKNVAKYNELDHQLRSVQNTLPDENLNPENQKLLEDKKQSDIKIIEDQKKEIEKNIDTIFKDNASNGEPNNENKTKNEAGEEGISEDGKNGVQENAKEGDEKGLQVTEEEKTALEKIATDNSVEGGFREVSNRIRKYVDPEMPFSEMTDEVYKEALKKKEEKPIEEKTGNEKGQIKKTVVTKRAYEGAFREDVKQELENIGLTREIETHEEAETKGNEIIDKLGLNTALEAVKKGDIEGAPAAHIYNAKLESINKEMLTEKDPSKLKELAKEQGKLLEILGNKALKSGQFSSYLGYIYEKSPLQYNLETQKQKYRDANNGVLPADVEARFEEYDKKLKEVTEKIQKAEERAKKAEDELAIKNIKAAAAKEKELGAKKKKDLEKAIEDLGSITIGSRSDKSSLVSEKARSSIRKAAHEFLTMKNQKFRDFIEVVEKKTGKLTDEEKDIFKKEFEDEQKVVEKTESTKSGIPKELIRNLVEGGIEDIDELTMAVMKDLGIEDTPENHRKTRDEITGYGKTSNPTKDALSKKISEMAGVGRLLSALEDVKKGLRSKRSGIQRRALIQRERELTKELRELTKDLPMDSADLAKYHKTALDAVKSRLKNRIEDLQAEIASRTKLNKNNKKVEYDTEANALVEERDELQKIHDEVFKDEGLTDEQRIKRALTAIENSHENYQHRIDTKQFIPIEKKPLPDDPRIIAAQVKLDAKKAEYEAAKLKEYPPKTQLEKDADALAKQIEAKEKTKQELIDKFNTGNLDVKKRTPQSYDNNPEIKLLNKQISDLNRMLAQRRNAAKLKRSPQQIATENAVKSAERELKSIEDMIASGNLIKVKKGSLVQQTAALKIAKDKLQMRREFLDDLREKAGIPEKIRVEKLKEAAKRSIDQNKERLNTGNFAKGRYEYKNGVMGKFKEYVKKETPDDEDLSSLLTEKAKWQKKFKREQEKVEQENRTKTEKIVDGFFNSILKVRGEFLLSNPKTLGKLLGSTIAGMIERGATEATGALSRFATKRIDAKADVEGGGWNGRALSDFYVKGIVKGLQDAKDFVSKSKGHESELDIIDKEQLSKQAEMKGFFGGIHQLEKSFLKRGTYEYALRKIVESKVKAKVDILDPLTTMQTMFEAMKEAEIIDAKERALEVAKKEILMGKNKANELFVSDPINKLKRLGTGGKLVASAYKYFFMFTRIGSNIMLETGKLGLGVPTSTAMRVSGIVKERLNGAENLSKALDSYIDKMTPEEANLIRELDKKGMVGISLFALGWFGAGSVGGLYVANDPDKEKQLKAGHIIINGYDIPSWWFHHPMFEIINIGATMHHLYDSYSKNNKEDNLPPIPHAALRTMGSFLSEDPFSKEHSALYETLESDNKAETFWGETVKSSVDPQLLQWWAKQQQGDIKLKPHTTGQYIKSGLPFWWQNVPSKNENKSIDEKIDKKLQNSHEKLNNIDAEIEKKLKKIK